MPVQVVVGLECPVFVLEYCERVRLPIRNPVRLVVVGAQRPALLCNSFGQLSGAAYPHPSSNKGPEPNLGPLVLKIAGAAINSRILPSRCNLSCLIQPFFPFKDLLKPWPSDLALLHSTKVVFPLAQPALARRNYECVFAHAIGFTRCCHLRWCSWSGSIMVRREAELSIAGDGLSSVGGCHSQVARSRGCDAFVATAMLFVPFTSLSGSRSRLTTTASRSIGCI